MIERKLLEQLSQDVLRPKKEQLGVTSKVNFKRAVVFT